jgi:hypothetical protein
MGNTPPKSKSGYYPYHHRRRWHDWYNCYDYNWYDYDYDYDWYDYGYPLYAPANPQPPLAKAGQPAKGPMPPAKNYGDYYEVDYSAEIEAAYERGFSDGFTAGLMYQAAQAAQTAMTCEPTELAPEPAPMPPPA